jgi:periplasmic copper chaperone A
MRLRALFLAVALLAVPVTVALAHDFNLGKLKIHHPWAGATPAGAKVAGGYVAIRNYGDEPDQLISVSSDVADMVQIHSMSMENDVMKMAEVTDGLEIKPGETLALKPGSFHIMFMGLKAPLVEKATFKADLTFAKSGTVTVDFVVEAKAQQDGQHN